MKTNFPKPYSTPKQIVQILKSRGMYFSDESKAVTQMLIMIFIGNNSIH